MDWHTYAWLKRGKRRHEVLRLLSRSKNPLSANDVRSSLKVALSQASFTLSELCSKKLVQCLNPLDKIGKLYTITEKGVEILNEI